MTSVVVVLERLDSSGQWIKGVIVTIPASDEPRWTAKVGPGTYRVLASAAGPSGTAEAVASPPLRLPRPHTRR